MFVKAFHPKNARAGPGELPRRPIFDYACKIETQLIPVTGFR